MAMVCHLVCFYQRLHHRTFSFLFQPLESSLYVCVAFPLLSSGSCCPFSLSSGGVMLETKGSFIRCSNTLDERLELIFENSLPKIRESLFGAPAKAGRS